MAMTKKQSNIIEILKGLLPILVVILPSMATLPITAEWMLVLKVFLRPAVTVGICLLIFVVMKKICPKILGLLTGGRF